MRYIIRLLLFWVIAGPIFYFFALPWLLTKLDAKAQAQSYDSCFAQLREQKMLDSPVALLRQPEAESYCQCVSRDLHFTTDDLPELVKKQTPARVTALMKPIVERCNAELQTQLNQAVQALPEPRVEHDKNGNEVLHF